MTELNYYLLDVFTKRQFGGNPLAVFPDADDLPTETMRKIANELNLSETTFLQKANSAGSDCTVRIFTPKRELPMAGHPTIGTAYAILKNRLLDPINDDHLVFDEGIGPVNVDFEYAEDQSSNLFMHQPLPEFLQVLQKGAIANLLSLEESEIVDKLPVQIVSCGVPLVFVPLTSLESVRRTKVRTDLLETTLGHVDSKEIFVFTQETENPESNVHCRMFAPRFGIPEDPATGGAHGPLEGYLIKYRLSDGKNIVSEQGFEMGRPSELIVRVTLMDDEIADVLVGGDCAEVGRGTIQIARS